ncbi:putative phiE125 gp8 family phage protein [Rhizobium sp. SG_E_25_P2]|uniref:head-tail connector protein n=1 Tax=Rhizobium sp. SG_E_25_P2 TaxID=2879942 RepID=UPI002476C230|nr:head-tail connector protein [Rhizobium sp. SG_E_25_P2]MDH6265532.1 putative phiE125 gp8 family phage protein [Rhizobium sp. SG_E_25_P2]
MAWLAAKVTTPPSGEPVSLAQVRQRLRIDATDDDNDIESMIREARDHVERYCNLRLSPQVMELQCDSFGDFNRISVSPIRGLGAISYIDATGLEQTLSSDVYELISPMDLEFAITLRRLRAWPQIESGSRITVVVNAGFSDVPPAIRSAIYLHVAAGFEKREDAPDQGATTFDRLLSNFRRSF